MVHGTNSVSPYACCCLFGSKTEKVAQFVQCDVTDYDQQAALYTAAETHLGGVDIIVNNAGIVERTPLREDNTGIWKKVVDIDLLAVIEGLRIGVQYLQKQGRGGVIINTASLAGLYPQHITPAYTAAKFGIVGLTRSFQGFPGNIRVNAVAPSFADTRIIDGIRDQVKSMGAMVTVDQVMDAFMLLIEDDSYNGDIARVTPRYGVPVVGRRRNSKDEKSKL